MIPNEVRAYLKANCPLEHGKIDDDDKQKFVGGEYSFNDDTENHEGEKIAISNTLNAESDIVFVVLHEIAHVWQHMNNIEATEAETDRMAIEWARQHDYYIVLKKSEH